MFNKYELIKYVSNMSRLHKKMLKENYNYKIFIEANQHINYTTALLYFLCKLKSSERKKIFEFITNGK